MTIASLGRAAFAAAAIGLGAGALSAPALAQGGTQQVRLASLGSAAVTVTLGKSRTLSTDRSFTDVVIGDPEVADVVPLTDRSVYVLGKKAGTTSVSAYDADKRLVGVIEVEVAHNAPRATQEIRRSVTADARVATQNGRLIVQGEAPDIARAERAGRIARLHGAGEAVNNLRVRGPQQVMLEVRFIEISRQAGRDLGVRLETNAPNATTRSGRGQVGVLGFFADASALATGAAPFGTIMGRLISGGTNVDILIQALETQGLARRLAEPNLVTLSGEKANFLAGGEVPIPVAQQNGTITLEFKKYGVGLTFQPTVLGNGVINLKVEPEVSQVDPNTSYRLGNIQVPAFITRRASSVVELKSGQSFAIAGLLQTLTESTTEQLPWLADLPVIGALFRSREFRQRETELVIIVTPHMVNPARPGQRLRTPFDSAKPGNDVDAFLIGKTEVNRDAPTRALPRPPMAPGAGHIIDLVPSSSGGPNG
jgi:pilus assembly protein CpaC